MKKYDNTKRLIEINVEEEQKSVNSSNPKKETKPTFKVLQALAPIANLQGGAASGPARKSNSQALQRFSICLQKSMHEYNTLGVFAQDQSRFRWVKQQRVAEKTVENKELSLKEKVAAKIGSMICKQKRVSPENEEIPDDDIDCDALENKMMRSLEKEKQTLKNWHKILMRVQMINAFKLSMRIED